MAGFFGVVVPFLDLVGVVGKEFDRGRTTLALDVRPELTNHFGNVHGGAVATLLDVAMASAARSTLPEGDGVVTVSMTMNFLRGGQGRLSAVGRVQQAGRSLVFCDGEVRDEAGELVATSIGTFKVRRRSADSDG
jgi:uncharacterized protein (TIGR00369 family)